jgi:hypothetical protein
VLANGADSLNVAAGATSFVMPTPVNFASAYSVTVQSGPAGLTCSVVNGAGTMGAANVTNVAVSCAAQSFNVGGTIQGLSAAGLVLSNGADSVPVDINATGFTMPTKVAFGAAYALSVSSQPNGLHCSVSASGTGTMGAADVTNVVVSCAPIVHTVGGTVGGLSSSGLVLQNNGADDTTIAAGATVFSMTTGLAEGASYAVTVKTQPVGLTCTVSGAAGTVSTLDVTSIAVICAPTSHAWTTSGNLSTGRGLHTATLLPNGQVLIAGGFTSSGSSASAELY